jgi:putative oxidoreductase
MGIPFGRHSEVFVSSGTGRGTICEDWDSGPAVFWTVCRAVESVCGALLIVGLVTRLASVPLLIDIAVAIATTKIPMLAKAGFWATMHEARTDLCMLLGLIFLLIAGAGSFSLDDHFSR